MLYDDFDDMLEAMGADYIYGEYNKVRDSGKCNMFIRQCVGNVMLEEDSNHPLGCAIIYHSNARELYAGILNNWSKYNK